MKKHVLFIMVAGLMIASLSACGTKSTADTETKKEEAQVTEASESAETENDSETVTENTGSESESTQTEAETEDAGSTSETASETKASGSATYVLNEGEAVSIMGKDALVTFEEDEEWEGGPLSFTWGEETIEVAEDAISAPTSYVIEDASYGCYALITAGDYDDMRHCFLVKMDEATGALSVCDDIWSSVVTDASGSLSLTKLVMGGRVDCFGTYSGFKTYDISGGSFSTQDVFWDLQNLTGDADYEYDPDSEYLNQVYSKDGRHKLVLAQDLDLGEVQIAAGEEIYPLAVDDQNKLFTFEYQGQQMTVSYEFDEENWCRAINGIGEYDLFVTVPYAG